MGSIRFDIVLIALSLVFVSDAYLLLFFPITRSFS